MFGHGGQELFQKPPLVIAKRCVSCPWTDSNVAHCLATLADTPTKASQQAT
jgi:hypothetical protein